MCYKFVKFRTFLAAFTNLTIKSKNKNLKRIAKKEHIFTNPSKLDENHRKMAYWCSTTNTCMGSLSLFFGRQSFKREQCPTQARTFLRTSSWAPRTRRAPSRTTTLPPSTTCRRLEEASPCAARRGANTRRTLATCTSSWTTRWVLCHIRTLALYCVCTMFFLFL